MEYPCHSPYKKRWFFMRVTTDKKSAHLRAIISHENVTDLKRAEEKLREQGQRIRMHARQLEESNIALKVLLRQVR